MLQTPVRNISKYLYPRINLTFGLMLLQGGPKKTAQSL